MRYLKNKVYEEGSEGCVGNIAEATAFSAILQVLFFFFKSVCVAMTSSYAQAPSCFTQHCFTKSTGDGYRTAPCRCSDTRCLGVFCLVHERIGFRVPHRTWVDPWYVHLFLYIFFSKTDTRFLFFFLFRNVHVVEVHKRSHTPVHIHTHTQRKKKHEKKKLRKGYGR